MSAKSSELLELLKELALLKELDEKPLGMPSQSEIEIAEFEERQTRKREISDQIKALAEPTDQSNPVSSP